MNTSEQLDKLATALAKAQAVIENAAKDTKNDFYKSRYADLASVWDACRKPLTDNGLSIVQALGSEGTTVTCTTMLLHTSGQFIRSTFGMTPVQNTPQAAGSCATYLRRYSLQSMVGIAPDDDDGNTASGVSPQGKPQARTSAPAATGREATSHDHHAAKANAMGEVAASLVAKATPQAMADSAASPTFDAKNADHCAYVVKWCQSRKQPHLVKSLTAAMHGKPFDKETFVSQWQAVDPERPDKEPL